MDEETLAAVRWRIEALAEPGGAYYVVCGRTGERPVPVTGHSFPDRQTAVEAAQTATTYRALLREYDPAAPVYDFIICQHRGAIASSPATASIQQEGDV
jgi:hypothetical protein